MFSYIMLGTNDLPGAVTGRNMVKDFIVHMYAIRMETS